MEENKTEPSERSDMPEFILEEAERITKKAPHLRIDEGEDEENDQSFGATHLRRREGHRAFLAGGRGFGRRI